MQYIFVIRGYERNEIKASIYTSGEFIEDNGYPVNGAHTAPHLIDTAVLKDTFPLYVCEFIADHVSRIYYSGHRPSHAGEHTVLKDHNESYRKTISVSPFTKSIQYDFLLN